MSYPGLIYPSDKNYINNVKNSGYFIFVDRNANNIKLLAGGDINNLLSENNKLLFIFDIHIAGTTQDIVDSLYYFGFDIEDINKMICFGINITNINTHESQQYNNIFNKQIITHNIII